MKSYSITNRKSGAGLGTYHADGTLEAVEAMCRDAGYASSQDAADALGQTRDEFCAELSVCEVPYEGETD